MNAVMPRWIPIRPDVVEQVRTRGWYDEQDYRAGWILGRAGEVEPRNCNFATWMGWRDAASRYGYLERIDVFRNRT